MALDLVGELVRRGHAGLHRLGERRATHLPERLLELRGRQAELVELTDARNPGRRRDRVLELGGGHLRLLDPLGVVGQPELDEPGPELAEVASARALLRELAHCGDSHGVADEHAVGDRSSRRVSASHERSPSAS